MKHFVTMRRSRFRVLSVFLTALILSCLLSGCAVRSIVSDEQPTGESYTTAETEASLIVPDAPALSEKPETNETEMQTSPGEVQYGNAVFVNTVDEFLSTLSSDTTVILSDGVYDLSTASDYGETKSDGVYSWEDSYDGYQLVIRNVRNLEIRGSSSAVVKLSAKPRYANVLTFRDCEEIIIGDLTAGHTEEPGYCSGGVLAFDNCESVMVNGCSLYGCGTLGLDVLRSRYVTLANSEIYDCSYGAVYSMNSYDVQVRDCSIHDCGKQSDGFTCFNLLETIGTSGFAVINCDISDNDTQTLLKSEWSDHVYLLGCGISGNRVTDWFFELSGNSPVVEDCAFTNNTAEQFYAPNFSVYAINQAGEDLITFDFDRMQRAEAAYEGMPALTQSESDEKPEQTVEMAEYHVSTVDELLDAIGPNRTVYLEGDLFDLSTASNYGGYGGEYYEWNAEYDGPSLWIHNVTNFHLIGQGKDSTTILAVPRYADVIRFSGGENISVAGLTAGHTEAGECAGDVLYFDGVNDAVVTDCGVFGCGVWGISATSCSNVIVCNTEVYSCTFGAITMLDTAQISLENLNIHDMPNGNNVSFYGCTDISVDQEKLDNGSYDLAAS